MSRDTMKRMWTERQVRALGVDATEQKSNLKVFEHIADADGHARFIEGEINLNSAVPEGVTKTYGRWSLSGTHLMIVIAGTIENTTALTFGSFASLVNLPQWITDKIVPISTSYVEIKGFTLYAEDLTTQTTTIYLRKSSNTIFMSNSALTLTAKRNFRYQFDLLIDNE